MLERTTSKADKVGSELFYICLFIINTKCWKEIEQLKKYIFKLETFLTEGSMVESILNKYLKETGARESF